MACFCRKLAQGSNPKRKHVEALGGSKTIYIISGLHKLWYPSIRDTSTWSKFGAHGDVFLFSNLGAL